MAEAADAERSHRVAILVVAGLSFPLGLGLFGVLFIIGLLLVLVGAVLAVTATAGHSRARALTALKFGIATLVGPTVIFVLALIQTR